MFAKLVTYWLWLFGCLFGFDGLRCFVGCFVMSCLVLKVGFRICFVGGFNCVGLGCGVVCWVYCDC